MEEKTDIRDYLHVIIKRRWTVITFFAVLVITVAIHSFTVTPIYEATTRLIIDKENPNVVSIQEVMAVDTSGTDYYQTQYKIIESRTVAREVIRILHLKENEEFFPKPNDNFIYNLKNSVVKTIASWKESITSLLKTEEGGAVHDISEEYEPDSALVSDFIDRIKVNPIRNSRLVDVSFQAKDPVLASKIVNTLANAYINQNLEIKLKAVQDAVRWLNSRIDDERKRVEKAEQALLWYKEKHSIVTDFSSDVEKITAQKLAEMNTQLVEAETKRVEAETRYKQAMALEGTPDMLDSIPEVLDNKLIQEIKTMEVDLYKRMSELSKKYGQKHPKMVAIESELKTLQKRRAQEVDRVINSLRNEYKVALAKENSLKAALAKQKKESLDLNQKAIEYGVLRREVESARNMYELLIKRFKETSITEDMRTGNIRVVDKAEVPKNPFKPRKKLNIILAIIVGLVMGIGIAFFFEYLDDTIKIPEDIESHLNIPYLGSVPAITIDSDGKPDSETKAELVTLHSPQSIASEAYRGVRTSVLFSSVESIPQVILISSSGPKEGKTITATNLSIAMAQSGSKVIVLDCDMRKPKIHEVFGISRDRGITNILIGNNDVKDAVFHTEIPKLDVIPCGPIPPNPSEIVGSSRMTKLLKILRNNYARIIIDSAPVTVFTDAVILSKHVDGVVLVIRANDTAREIVKNGLSHLQNVGAHILGAVLNGVDMGRDGYYYKQYYHYYYSEGREKKKESHRRRKPEEKHTIEET